MTRRKWGKISSVELLKHPRVPVREDTVRLPDGSETNYAVLELPDAVTVVIRKGDAFLLNLEYAYPVDDSVHRPENQTSDGWLYKFPGGMLQKDESFKAAAIREVQEETGLKIDNVSLLAAVRNFFPRSNSIDYKVFAKISGQGQQNRDVEESDIRQKWKTAAEIDDMIRGQDPRVLHSHFLDTWGLYKTR